MDDRLNYRNGQAQRPILECSHASVQQESSKKRNADLSSRLIFIAVYGFCQVRNFFFLFFR